MNAPSFTQHFDRYVCEGDMIETSVAGTSLRIVATIERDNESEAPDENQDGYWPSLDPDDAGWIGPDKTLDDLKADRRRQQATLDAWRNDEWYYCGVVLSVWLGDVCLDDHAASLWCVECNYPPHDENPRPNNYLREVANDLLGEALDAAQASLQAFVVKVSDAQQALAVLQA